MIEVTGLTKRYGNVTAVDDLTFSIAPGKVTGFLGPNGAGKSTTMRMIIGLDRPTAGTATIDGKPYAELTNPLRKVGSLLDAKSWHPNRSAHNRLKWIAQSNGIPTSRVDEVLRIVGLSEVAKKKVGGFSLGMGQRLGLAAALLGDPEVLILDEPVNGLDPEGIVWMRTLMRSLAAEGRTVLVSSHLLSEMANTADHLIVIGRGKLIANAPMNEFIGAAGSQSALLRTPDMDVMKQVLAQEGFTFTEEVDSSQRQILVVHDVSTDRLGALAFSHGITVFELQGKQSTLEQAFMESTGAAQQFSTDNPSEV
ncbi:ABC transporter ATP-binding protein [Corynebacterium choanae]|uniref:Putative ABC transporter ATP-binding protein YxlF n=1 Tax=Corynebacterium choanae TaxID=1862358 RepID=A0A3G6J8B4_9CORY|nr:ABC transporter ATP-binding protein [Corynebacterium choanae]AZA12690.1 putative ABC transporter ATP-binding protein YxlF [Corynebacterium choanae]